MAETSRPSHIFSHHHHHLPPPPVQFGNAPATAPSGFSGLVLAPLAVPSPGVNNVDSKSGSGGSTVVLRHRSLRQQQPSPLAHQPHVPPSHHPHHHPHHLQHRQSPVPVSNQQQLRADGRATQSFGHLPPPLSSYAPPTTPTFAPALSYDSGFDPRYPRESSDRRRSSLSTMIPSPTFAGQTTPLEDASSNGYSRFPQHRVTMEESESSARHDVVMLNRSQGGRYQIQVRQQPAAARACGFGERDRRVIDPPPIVELIINDPVTGFLDPNEIRYPFNVVHCTLWSEDGCTDETALTGADKRLTRRLMGTLVSSPFVGMDEQGDEGCFFCFPDLSCRTHGKYRLRFVLMRLEPCDLQPEGYTPIITECMSDVFTVYTAKEFPGMRPSTYLTKALKRQGCAISVKKGNEKAAEKATSSSERNEQDGVSDDDTTATGNMKRRRKT